jgi:hypothetical protein
MWRDTAEQYCCGALPRNFMLSTIRRASLAIRRIDVIGNSRNIYITSSLSPSPVCQRVSRSSIVECVYYTQCLCIYIDQAARDVIPRKILASVHHVALIMFRWSTNRLLVFYLSPWPLCRVDWCASLAFNNEQRVENIYVRGLLHPWCTVQISIHSWAIFLFLFRSSLFCDGVCR